MIMYYDNDNNNNNIKDVDYNNDSNNDNDLWKNQQIDDTNLTLN